MIQNQSLRWLMPRLARLNKAFSVLPERELHELEQKLEATPGEDTSASFEVVDTFCKRLGFDVKSWQNQPLKNTLPMLALLPGFGLGIIYTKSKDGVWLFESSMGSQQLHTLPEGSLFTSLLVKTHQDSGVKSTAYELFKSSLLEHRSLFVYVGFASLLANLLAVSASLYTMQVYDRVIPTQGLSTLVVLTVGVGLAIIFELLIKLTRSHIMETAIRDMDQTVSHQLFQRLLGVRMDQFPKSVGTLSSQIRSYETIRAFATTATLYILVDGPFALLFLAIIYLIAGLELALVPTVFYFLALMVGLFYHRKISTHANSSSSASNKKLGLLVETVENAEKIKAQGDGWQFLHRWDGLSRQTIDDDIKIKNYSEHANYFAGFIQQASYVSLISVGAYLTTQDHTITMGSLIAAAILSGRVLQPVTVLPNLVVQWAHARIALSNIEHMFDLETDHHGVSRPLTPENIGGKYELSGITFSYIPDSTTVTLNCLVINKGEKVGILGPVGSGKSTLLKIMAGLYKPQQGRVLLDNLDIQQISRPQLSAALGYLPQEIKLFGGTLRENLLSGTTNVEESTLLQTCQQTGLMSLISTHPKGLDLIISEGGAGVSGGQRQQIALTRLLVTNPKIWLLDEPTAAIDEQTEHTVLFLLKERIQPDQTLLLVTHKPLLLNLVERLVILTSEGIIMDGPRDVVLENLKAKK